MSLSVGRVDTRGRIYPCVVAVLRPAANRQLHRRSLLGLWSELPVPCKGARAEAALGVRRNFGEKTGTNANIYVKDISTQ